MGQIRFCLAQGIVQIDLSARLQRQALGDLVGELVEIFVVLIVVLGDSAIEVVRYVLANLGVGSVVLLAVGVAHNLFLDGRNTSFLGDVNGCASHDSKDGRCARLTLINSVSFGHKEPVTMFKTGDGTISRCLFVSKIVHSSGNFISNIIRTNAICIVGSRHLIRNPVRSILRSRSRIRCVRCVDNALDSILYITVRPSDVARNRLTFNRSNIGLKNLIAIEFGMVVLNVRDFHRAVRSSSRALSCKRHGHRRHHSAKAQGCG